MLYALVAEATATTTSSVRRSGSDFRILGRLQSLLNLTFKEASLPDPPRVAKATAPELATPPAPERWSAELTAGAPGKQWHPTCLAELAHKPPSTCVHGPRTFNCTYTWADFLRSQPHLGASGAWESKGTTPYLLDRGLATALARYIILRPLGFRGRVRRGQGLLHGRPSYRRPHKGASHQAFEDAPQPSGSDASGCAGVGKRRR